MGFDLPAAVGAAVATRGARVICVAGDGSIMMNLQELQTIKGYAMPVKIFLYNNRGYHSIRQTQQNCVPGNPVGYGPESGVTVPNYERIAYGFDLPFARASSCRCRSTRSAPHPGASNAARAARVRRFRRSSRA